MTGHVLDSHLHLIDPCRLDYSWIELGDDLDQKWHPAPRRVRELCARAAALCEQRGVSLEKLALQFSVMTSPCVTTVVGSASSANIRRDAAWVSEPIDASLLADVEAVLTPVRDMGWLNGRPENQDPGRAS